MDATGINQVIREVFGNTKTEIINGWVSLKCPLAPWTHESGRDTRASSGVSIKPSSVSVFNCLSGETRVITRAGVKSIENLAGSNPELLMPDGTWQRAPVKAFGKQRLVALHLSRNGRKKVVYATENHRWFAKSGSASPYLERTTIELKRGYRMQPAFSAPRTSWALDRVGVLHGLVFGDGTQQVGTRFGSVCLYGKCEELAGYVSSIPGLSITKYVESEHTKCYTRVHGSLAYMKGFPKDDATEEYLLGFLSGLIAADGHVDERGNVSLASASLLVLKRVNDLCVRLGIAVSGVYGQLRSGFGRPASALYTMRFFAPSIDPSFFVKEDQQERAATRSKTYARTHWVVEKVEATALVREVFCAEVQGHHAFALADNLLTGNCFTCGNRMPFHGMLRKYAGFSGEDLDDLIEELEEESYLGPRELPTWDAKDDDGMREQEPLKQSVYLDLYDSARGHPYLRKRGISDATVDKLQLMVDPSDPADGEERILFPVFGADGELYGLSGRATHPEAKLKVRDYFGLRKAANILGAHLIAREKPNKVLLLEGLFDYANAWEQGYPAGAVMHSTLTARQAEIVRDFGLPTYLFYDDDEAGQKGCRVAGTALYRYLPVMKVRYPEIWVEEPDGGEHRVKDPGELLAEDFEYMIQDCRLWYPT